MFNENLNCRQIFKWCRWYFGLFCWIKNPAFSPCQSKPDKISLYPGSYRILKAIVTRDFVFKNSSIISCVVQYAVCFFKSCFHREFIEIRTYDEYFVCDHYLAWAKSDTTVSSNIAAVLLAIIYIKTLSRRSCLLVKLSLEKDRHKKASL